ncbi:MAG: ribosome recycling factor, partial [Caldiserica bacterium]
MKEFIKSVEEKMEKVIKNLQHEFSVIRTGRANPHLLDGIMVEYYGTNLPINQVATISIPEPRTIEIKPWDVNAISSIEKAILKSDLGVNPQNDGKIIRINLPPLTEERRKELTKIVKKIAESHRVSLRNI